MEFAIVCLQLKRRVHKTHSIDWLELSVYLPTSYDQVNAILLEHLNTFSSSCPREPLGYLSNQGSRDWG